MTIRSMNFVPMQNRPVIDGVVVALDKRVVPPGRALKRAAGTLHLPGLALVKAEPDG